MKKQLQLMEEKLDRLQKQTTANTVAAAKAKAEARVSVANADATLPVRAPALPPKAIVEMPNNRPTICTADEQNCAAITSRLHFDRAVTTIVPIPRTPSRKASTTASMRVVPASA